VLEISPPRPWQTALGETSCRQYYRKLAAGVAVVTANGSAGWSGTTVSTVTSVSLDPPIVLFCVARGSRTLAAIRYAGSLAIHLLADDQFDLADRFSRSPSDSSRFAELGRRVSLIDGIPVIADALAVGRCQLHSLHEVGDHVVIYGELSAVQVGQGRPMLWHERQYQMLAPPAGGASI
jgi:flavin reductase (DIM6/NTAB) family NADH-FMN oxidoreductase RutF